MRGTKASIGPTTNYSPLRTTTCSCRRLGRTFIRRTRSIWLVRSVITGPVLAARPERPGAFAPSTSSGVSRRTYMGRVPDDVLFAGNMAIRRAAFREVGPFDERLGLGARFPAAEDDQLRLSPSGLATGSCRSQMPSCSIAPGEIDVPTFPLRWRYGRGQGGYLAKHLSRTDFFMFADLSRTSWSHLAGIHSLRRTA